MTLTFLPYFPRRRDYYLVTFIVAAVDLHQLPRQRGYQSFLLRTYFLLVAAAADHHQLPRRPQGPEHVSPRRYMFQPLMDS